MNANKLQQLAARHSNTQWETIRQLSGRQSAKRC